MRRALLSAALIVAALAISLTIGYVIIVKQPKPPKAIQPPLRRVAVEVMPVEVRPFTQYVRVTGTVAAMKRARVSAEVAGEVVRIPSAVALGKQVRTRQVMLALKDVLWRIDRDRQRARLERQRANLEVERNEARRKEWLLRIAEEKLKLSQTELERRRSLLARGFISHQLVDQARQTVESARGEYAQAKSSSDGAAARIKLAQADVDAARAELARADESLRNTRVRAPFDAYISEKLVQVGDRVAVGEPLFTVVDLANVKVNANVSSKEVSALRPGMAAAVILDAAEPRTFAGTLAHVGVESSDLNRTFPIEVVAPNDEVRSLLPGMFVRVRIVVREHRQAILVPRHAVRSDDGARPYVYVATKDRSSAVKRAVTVGGRYGDSILVRAGLQAHDNVVLSGLELLTDGSLINVLNETTISNSVRPLPAAPGVPPETAPNGVIQPSVGGPNVAKDGLPSSVVDRHPPKLRQAVAP